MQATIEENHMDGCQTMQSKISDRMNLAFEAMGNWLSSGTQLTACEDPLAPPPNQKSVVVRLADDNADANPSIWDPGVFSGNRKPVPDVEIALAVEYKRKLSPWDENV